MAAPAAAQDLGGYWRTLSESDQPQVVRTSQPPVDAPDVLVESLRLVRLYELTGDEAAGRRAVHALREARVPPRHGVWGELAAAIVLARGPDSHAIVFDDDPTDAVYDVYSLASLRSLRMLRSVLEREPQLRAAALELARWAWDRQDTGVAREAAVHLARLEPDAAVRLARARTLLLAGRPEDAAPEAEAALRAGAEPGHAHYLRAVALLQDTATERAGADAYYAGVRAGGDVLLDYTRGLLPLLDTAQLERWRALEPAQHEPWLRGFWARRGAEVGVSGEERLAVHYRRLHGAWRDYRSNPTSLVQIQAPYMTGLDSRRFNLSLKGLMLVRHGDPHRLREIEGCLGSTRMTQGTGIICGAGEARLRKLQRSVALARGQTHSPFDAPLRFAFRVYRFRGEAGATDVAVSIGLPVEEALRLRRAGRADLEAAAALVAPDSVLTPDQPGVARTEWSQPLPDVSRLRGSGMLLTEASLPARPPIRGSTRVVVSLGDDAGAAGGVGHVDVEVEPMDASTPGLSDLVVAPVDVTGGLRRGDVVVPLAPLRTYGTDETFALYYEVYGVAPGATYRTEIVLEPRTRSLLDRLRGLFGLAEDGLRLSFDATAGTVHPVLGLQERRTVDAAGIPAGEYTLRVTVTDAAGSSSQRSAPLVIEERAR